MAATGTSEARRIEAGILDTQFEICPDHNPYEVGLERWVDLDKPTPFVGQSALREIERQDISKKLVGFTSPERVDGRQYDFPWPVTIEAARVGKATAAVWSPSLEQTIGFAMVSIKYAALGTMLTVETPQGAMMSKVSPFPFIDPEKKRMRG